MGGCLSTLCGSGEETPQKAEDEQKLEVNQNGNPTAKTISARGVGGAKDNPAFNDNEGAEKLNQVMGSTFRFLKFQYVLTLQIRMKFSAKTFKS